MEEKIVLEKVEKLSSEEARSIKKGDKLKVNKSGGLWDFEVYAILNGVEDSAPYFKAKYQRKWLSWKEFFISRGWV